MKVFRIETMFKMQECLESNLSDLTSNNDHRDMTQIKDYLDMTKNALSMQLDNSLNLDQSHGMTNNDLRLLLMAYCAWGTIYITYIYQGGGLKTTPFYLLF